MKKIFILSLIVGGVFLGGINASASELVNVDVSSLANVTKLQIDSDVLKAGSVEYINNDILYNVDKEGNLIKSLKNDLELPKGVYNDEFTLGNGEFWTKRYSVGKVRTSYTTGRQDGGIAQRFQYIENNSTGQYAYVEEVNAARSSISLDLPSAGDYTYGMMSRMMNATNYYVSIVF